MPIHTKNIGAGKLVTVDFPANLYRNFYNGMSNSAIWPILHDRADLLHYDERFFQAYSEINDLMADAIARIAQPDALIWVHDYHFFMLGDCLRRRGITNSDRLLPAYAFPHRLSAELHAAAQGDHEEPRRL